MSTRCSLDCVVDALFAYERPQLVRFNLWQLGLLLRLLQLACVCYLGYKVASNRSWLAHVPVTDVSQLVYGESTAAFEAQSQSSSLPPYCNNQSLSYAYSDLYNYDALPCRYRSTKALVHYLSDGLFITTASIVRYESLWPCGGEKALRRKAQCNSTNGTMFRHVATGQCGCRSAFDRFYALGADMIGVGLDHSFRIPADSPRFGRMVGTSIRAASVSNALQSTQLLYVNGSSKDFSFDHSIDSLDGGHMLWMPLHGWLAAAGVGDLNERHPFSYPDHRHEKVLPPIRSVGATLDVSVEYSNLDRRGLPGTVHATVRVAFSQKYWTSQDWRRTDLELATVEGNAEVASVREEYSTGVAIHVKMQGTLYYYDFLTFINSTLAGLALLAGVQLATTMLICLCSRPMHYALRRQHVDKLSFRDEVGHRMTLRQACAQFTQFIHCTPFTYDSHSSHNSRICHAVVARLSRSAHCPQPLENAEGVCAHAMSRNSMDILQSRWQKSPEIAGLRACNVTQQRAVSRLAPHADPRAVACESAQRRGSAQPG